MSDLLSGAKDVIFGNEQKIAKPISNFTGIGFNAPASQVDTFKGGFNFNRSPESQAALSGVAGSFGQLSGELGDLKSLVSPAFGGLTRVGTQAIEDARRKTVGDLKENLSRRKVLGSSFASDDITRTQAEFAKQQAQFQTSTKLQEIETTAQLATQQYEASAKGAQSILEQGNFETTIAAELSRQYTSALSKLAEFESQLLRDEADGVTSAIGFGTTALLGGALGGIGAGLLGGGAAGGAAAGTAAGAAGGAAAGGLASGMVNIPGIGPTSTASLQTTGLAAGAGFAGNQLAKSLPGDQTNIESNIGAIAGTALGAIFMPGVGAIAGGAIGGFLGTALGSAVNSVFGKKGGGEDKPDYQLAVSGAGATASDYGSGVGAGGGPWGSVGFFRQKHINDTDAYQNAFESVIEIDKAVSQMFTPEQNAAIAAEMNSDRIVAQNTNEGGYTPGRAATQIFNDRAKALERVLGPEAFASTGLKQLYAALASGDQAALESLFDQQQGTQEVAQNKYSIPTPVGFQTFGG